MISNIIEIHLSIEVVYLLFLDGNTAGRVHDIATGSCMVGRINGRKKQLLLNVRESHEVLLGLIRLDGWILRDNTCARAGSIQQDSVESAHDTRELSRVIRADDNILCPQSVDVTNQTLGTCLVWIVGDNNTRVLYAVSLACTMLKYEGRNN